MSLNAFPVRVGDDFEVQEHNGTHNVTLAKCYTHATAARIIAALRAEVATPWVSVKDRLPPELEEVLLDHLVDDHKHTIDIAWHKGGVWSFPWIGRLSKEETAPVWPVRWQPLPALDMNSPRQEET